MPTPTKTQQIADWLMANKGYTFQPATPAHKAILSDLQQENAVFGSNWILSAQEILGTYAGYTILSRVPSNDPSELPFAAVRIAKKGKYPSTKISQWPMFAATQEELYPLIVHRIARNAATRQTNNGLWQRQLPLHLRPRIFTPNSGY